MRKAAIAIVLITLGSGADGQGVRTVGELLRDCAADLGSPEALLCGGIVEGMTQALIWNCVSRDYGWEPDPSVVAESPPTIGAAVEAFLGWGRAHPDQWEEEWQLGVAAALSQAYPCPRWTTPPGTPAD